MKFKECVWNLLFANDVEFVGQHYYPAKELDRIRVLEGQLKMIQELYDNTNDEFTEEKEELEILIADLTENIRILKTSDDSVQRPDWLILPSTLFIPKVRIATRTGEVIVKISPNDIYTSSGVIRKMVADNNLKQLYIDDKAKCARTIWKLVIDALKYEYDKEEDWRFSVVTLAYKKGDCEDGTILFLDLAKEAGFKSDEVFNGTGYVTNGGNKFGHSYPLVNTGDGWFIYESTLDFLPSSPMRFLGSNYTADWGLYNFKWSGKIKNALQL